MWGVIIVLALLIPLIAVVLDSAPARALASRLERDGLGPGPAEARRIAALEDEVERLRREVERLDEESRFLHVLLEQRPEPPPELPPAPPGA